MYKLEIELDGWSDTVTIQTSDFNKIAILQEFIALQEECGWTEEEEELVFTDEDGVTYYYDEELDLWVEVEEDEEEEDEEE
jgi:hypothetical protein